jgi:hypothetical protein
MMKVGEGAVRFFGLWKGEGGLKLGVFLCENKKYFINSKHAV